VCPDPGATFLGARYAGLALEIGAKTAKLKPKGSLKNNYLSSGIPLRSWRTHIAWAPKGENRQFVTLSWNWAA